MLVEMEYVYAVYREKSFSKAAQRLFISQSAVSAMVRKVEKKIGQPIFDRSTIPLTVTEEGRSYIAFVEEFALLEKNMEAYFKDLTGLKTGHLVVGSSSFLCIYYLVDLVKRFKQKYPGVSIDLREGNMEELRNGLMEGSINLLLETALPENEEIERCLFDYEHIILGVPADYEVNKKLRDYQMSFEEVKAEKMLDPEFPAVALRLFSKYPFIFLKKQNDIYLRSMDMCRDAGFTPYVEVYLDQIMTAYYVAGSGAGITFIRSSLLNLVAKTDSLVYYKLGHNLAKRKVCLSYKKGRYLSRAARAFLELSGVKFQEEQEQ